MARPGSAGDPPQRDQGWWGKALLEQRLVALFGAGCLLLNFPLLALWDREGTLAGVPLFPAALFLVWAGLIVALGWLIEHADDGPDPGHGPTAGDRPASRGGGNG